MSLTLCTSCILLPGTLLTYLRWNLGIDYPKWIISRMVKLLQRLPRLCELSLVMNKRSKLFDHLVDCFAKLHNLHKLSFRFVFVGTNSKINSIAKIIAANPNLTHLEVIYDDVQDLAQTFKHVPADRPLKLEHLRLYRSFYNAAALAPHISCLTSIDIADSELLSEFLKQNIFPPTMTFWRMDQYTLKYLDRHPRIVSLTDYGCHDASTCSTLLGILSRHSETITHLGFCHWVLFMCINQMKNELALLQCTNLKQLLLDHRPPGAWRIAIGQSQTVSLTRSDHPCHVLNVKQEAALSIISRLPGSLTLAINDDKACVACTRFCSRSSNPLVRDLAKRIVFQYMDHLYS